MSTSSPRSASTRSVERRPPGRRSTVPVSTPQITLGEFLKWAGIAPTGGQAKLLAHAGRVSVNGAVERRRGRQLRPGDRVAVGGREYHLVAR